MSTITTGSIPRLLQEGLQSIFGNAYMEHQTEYDKIFDVEKSSKAYEVDQLVEGFGLAPQKTEGDDLAYDSMQAGIQPKYVNLTYAKGFIVTKEAMDDEQYSLFAKRAKALAFSMRQTKDVTGANILNRGFNSSYTMSGGDGQQLFDTDHRDGPNGSTFQNMLTVPADLSEASLEDMMILIGNATDSRGLQIALQGTRLIVPTDLQFDAQRILGSTLQNDTANNATNSLRDMRALRDGFVVNHYLTDTDAWFVRTNCPDGLKCMERQAVEFGEDNAFNSGNMRFKATERYSFGWSDARSIYGTAGA
jgi:phage major head subunit gpT-like protein